MVRRSVAAADLPVAVRVGAEGTGIMLTYWSILAALVICIILWRHTKRRNGAAPLGN